MAQLASRDLQAILDYTLEARSFASVAEYRTGILPGLRSLVACDVVGYNEIDPVRRTAVLVNEPAGAFFEGVEEVFSAVIHQHPIVAAAQAGDGRTYKLSDFLTEGQFHGLELYQDMYRLVGAEDQIAFSLPGKTIIGIAMNRPDRSFSERDRQVLEVVRPHLGQAYEQARERGLAIVLINALEEGFEEAGGGVIVLNARGGVVHAGESARELLAAYLGPPPGDGTVLPNVVVDWLDRHTPDWPGEPLVVPGPRGRLVVRRLPRLHPHQPVLVLEERRLRPPSVASLRALGLTRRQAEVLRLVATGRSNSQIAGELFVSIPTVRKHLEHVYARLGVTSRAAAVARALNAGP
jgi:DNA-binding CsgD family transcriptional regulator